MISSKKQNEYLIYLMDSLINAKKDKIKLDGEWLKKFPDKPGVYVFFEKFKLVYVGETKSIKVRMKNVLNTRQHTLRRKIGKYNFSDTTEYEKASTNKKFPLAIEEMVNNWMINKMRLSFSPISLGRKELEELIIEKFNPKYNSIGRRSKK